MKRFLKINAADNVAVALADDLHEGETLDVEGVAVTLREDVARGHKFALRDIAAGENVVKYGYPIGHATQDVPQGGWIHSHNLKTNLRDDLEYSYTPKVYDVDFPRRDVRVMGYLRRNGASCAMQTRRSGLMGRRTWQAARTAYETLLKDGRLPATFEVVYGHAWKAQPTKTADGRAIVRFDPKQRLR